ncbi:helix-turn-helix domain-containing protein [Alkalihalobacillus sp. TS-13]|uniref:helix-turn-helix domain-containing protein n=1 Tax=Alkalihalobacillus sp. TS-13 TaxID=2842455 RepID=UPI001C877F8A|nr:AraC family transcriptional regulator [Alkalihalobacillus sp. TS-13]
MPKKYPEVDEVIKYIHQYLHEPLSVSELARHAAYSKFHFTRIFKERMGLAPQYYISAIRLQKAKDLLLCTDLSVRDIGLEIGQESLGTFTTRFTERVGVTPSQFRNSKKEVNNYLSMLQDWTLSKSMSTHTTSLAKASEGGKIQGTVQADVPFSGFIFVGLFAKPIFEGFPLYGTMLSSLGDFRFTGVKPGAYYLMATSVSKKMQGIDILFSYKSLQAGLKEPIIIEPYSPVPFQKMNLRSPRLDDPPIISSLPYLIDRFLEKGKESINRKEIISSF